MCQFFGRFDAEIPWLVVELPCFVVAWTLVVNACCCVAAWISWELTAESLISRSSIRDNCLSIVVSRSDVTFPDESRSF